MLLNELKLGSFSSIDGSLDSVFPSKPGKFRIKEITPQLISHLFKEDYMAAVQTYYNLFQIYDITGNTEQAKEYINISYNNVMEIASKLRRADRKKFLTKNKYISSIVSNWEEANK